MCLSALEKCQSGLSLSLTHTDTRRLANQLMVAEWSLQMKLWTGYTMSTVTHTQTHHTALSTSHNEYYNITKMAHLATPL